MMEELSADELDEVLRAPQPKARKPKTPRRDVHTWFYDIPTSLGTCDNPECTDNRKRAQVYVWTHPETNLNMCRFCFYEGWLTDAD